MLRTALLCTALVVAPCFAFSQPPPDTPPPTGTGLILGRVVDAAGSRPIAGAMVTLAGAGIAAAAGTPPRVLADREGRFVFRAVPKGSYSLSSTKTGYAPGAFGRHRPSGPGQQLEIDDGQRVGDVAIAMWKGGAISGTVTDEAGEPVVGLSVSFYRRGPAGGRRALLLTGTATTDDRGMYRYGGLVPGEWIVAIHTTTTMVPQSVADLYSSSSSTPTPDRERLLRQLMTAQATAVTGAAAIKVGDFLQPTVRSPMPPPPAASGRVFAYPPIFYPNSTTPARATPITVASGQERTGIDLPIRPVPVARITGTVIGPEGPVPHLALLLVPGAADELIRSDSQIASAITDANGAFVLAGVPPGQYMLRAALQPQPARATPTTTSTIQVGSGVMFGTVISGDASGDPAPVPVGPTFWTDMPIAVGDADLSDLTVTLRTGPRVSGRVEFDGAAERPQADRLQRLSFRLEPVVAGGQATMLLNLIGRADATGNFTTPGVPGGRYFVRAANPPPGWTFKSATYEGRDLADTAIDLSSDISGVVVTFTDRPTQLTGTVLTGNAPDPDATVVIFPAEKNAWADWPSRRIRMERTTRSGAFKLPNLPPGDYLAVALTSDSLADWEDVQGLERLSQHATSVTINGGEARSLNLRAVRIGR